MKEAANRGKGKTLLISAGMEIMLIICITAANLNPTPILYFIFYNLLYGLVFSLFIPLYCLYKENGVSVSGSVLTEAGFKKPGIRQGGGVFWRPLWYFPLEGSLSQRWLSVSRSHGACCLWELCR